MSGDHNMNQKMPEALRLADKLEGTGPEMIKFGDRVRVTSPTYCCANLGEQGMIVDNGHPTQNGLQRYLVRWDSNPSMIFGVYSDSIKED